MFDLGLGPQVKALSDPWPQKCVLEQEFVVLE